MKLPSFWKVVLKSLLLCLVLAFLAIYIARNWERLDKFTYEFHWIYLTLSILSLLASLLFLPLALKRIVRLLAYEIPFRRMCLILFYSQVAKYLPGGIWGYVGRVYLYRREGMSATDASTCVILETLLVLLSGILIFWVSLIFFGRVPSVEWLHYDYVNGIGPIVLVVFLSFIHPKVLNFLWRLIPAKFFKNEFRFNYSYWSVLKPAVLLVCFWLGVGGSFWLLIKSFYPIKVSYLPVVTQAYVFAWIVGFLAFFTPGGLGTREAVLVISLNLYLPVSISTVTAVAARLWWIVGELVWTLYSFLYNRFEEIGKENIQNRVQSL